MNAPVLNTELKDYQKEGIQFILQKHLQGINPIVADETGIGKTLQVLEVVARLCQGPALIICPPSVENVWFSECEKHYSGFNIASIENVDCNTLYHYNAIVIRYDCLKNLPYPITHQNKQNYQSRSQKKKWKQAELLFTTKWTAIILDEVHCIRGLDTQRYEAVKRLKTQSHLKIAISATIYHNNLIDFFNLFEFMGYESIYGENYPELSIWKSSRIEDISVVYNVCKYILSNVTLRRNYKDLGMDICEMERISVVTEFQTEKEIWLYAQIWNKLQENLKIPKVRSQYYNESYTERLDDYGCNEEDFTSSASAQIETNNVLTAFQKLLQIATWAPLVAPNLFTYEEKAQCAKIKALEYTVINYLIPQEKFIIYTQYLELLRFLGTYMEDRFQYQVVLVYGSVTTKQRKEIFDRFQDSGVTNLVLVSTTQTGGVGIDLTAACKVVFMDMKPNPQIGQTQPQGRVQRLSQSKPLCTSFYIETRNTIERNLKLRCLCKLTIAQSLLDDSMDITEVVDALNLLTKSLLRLDTNSEKTEVLQLFSSGSFVNTSLSNAEGVLQFLKQTHMLKEDLGAGDQKIQCSNYEGFQTSGRASELVTSVEKLITVPLSNDIMRVFHGILWKSPIYEINYSNSVTLDLDVVKHIQQQILPHCFPFCEGDYLEVSYQKTNYDLLLNTLHLNPQINTNPVCITLILLSEYLNCCNGNTEMASIGFYTGRTQIWCDFSHFSEELVTFALLCYDEVKRCIFLHSFGGFGDNHPYLLSMIKYGYESKLYDFLKCIAQTIHPFPQKLKVIAPSFSNTMNAKEEIEHELNIVLQGFIQEKTI